jgi:hypothetical protein
MQDLSPQNNASDSPPPCFIEFRAPEQERFRTLVRAFEILKQEKHKLNEILSDDDEGDDDEEQGSEQKVQSTNDSHEQALRELREVFFDLFDEHVLAHFWWPSEQERQEYWQRWWATPVPQRWTDPTLKHPWDFESMIDSFLNGEYELLSCRLLTSDTAVLEFLPFGFPYGGTECMKALVEAFDFQVIGEDDGTGYVSYL